MKELIDKLIKESDNMITDVLNDDVIWLISLINNCPDIKLDQIYHEKTYNKTNSLENNVVYTFDNIKNILI